MLILKISMVRVKIHELAAGEFEEAIEWYQHRSKGLGNRFKKSVIEQVKKIKKKSGMVFS